MNKRTLLWTGILAGASAVLAAVLFVRSRTVRGSGNVITRTLPVDPFKRISIGNASVKIEVSQAGQDSVQIEADDNLIDRLKAEVKDGTLRLSFESAGEFIRPSQPAQVRVSARDIDKLTLKGQGRVTATAFKTDALELALAGKGELAAGPLDVRSLTVNLSGVGKCTVTGKADEQAVKLSGIGACANEGLVSRTGRVVLSGVGRAEVDVREKLDITISGIGNVTYHGEPEVTRAISGVGAAVAAPALNAPPPGQIVAG